MRKTFPTYLIDEYKTSKISSTTLTETNKLNLRINGYMCELYPVLTFSMSNQRLGCINRDKNATLNFQKIIRSLIETQKRPIEFLRAQPKSSINPPKLNTGVSNNGKPQSDNITDEIGANRGAMYSHKIYAIEHKKITTI